jgi:hypothetical protein
MVLVSSAKLRHRVNAPVLLWGCFSSLAALMVGDSTRQAYYLVYAVVSLTMLASASLYGAWLEYPRWRPALVAVVFAVLAVQSATILSRIRSNPMGRAFLPVVSFLDGNYSNRRIYGSAELGMALGFPRNYVDDPSLGFYTHSEPDAFVVEDVGYQQSFAAFRTKSPEVYNYIGHLRDSYVCVYDRGNYRVYSRRGT